jgi:hypothetical protein
MALPRNADALNTNQVLIDVPTPGGTVTSASGVAYATTTPEPASVLVLAGIAGLLVGCGRKRSAAGISRTN